MLIIIQGLNSLLPPVLTFKYTKIESLQLAILLHLNAIHLCSCDKEEYDNVLSAPEKASSTVMNLLPKEILIPLLGQVIKK